MKFPLFQRSSKSSVPQIVDQSPLTEDVADEPSSIEASEPNKATRSLDASSSAKMIDMIIDFHGDENLSGSIKPRHIKRAVMAAISEDPHAVSKLGTIATISQDRIVLKAALMAAVREALTHQLSNNDYKILPLLAEVLPQKGLEMAAIIADHAESLHKKKNYSELTVLILAGENHPAALSKISSFAVIKAAETLQNANDNASLDVLKNFNDRSMVLMAYQKFVQNADTQDIKYFERIKNIFENSSHLSRVAPVNVAVLKNKSDHSLTMKFSSSGVFNAQSPNAEHIISDLNEGRQHWTSEKAKADFKAVETALVLMSRSHGTPPNWQSADPHQSFQTDMASHLLKTDKGTRVPPDSTPSTVYPISKVFLQIEIN